MEISNIEMHSLVELDEKEWEKFVKRYTPVIHSYGRMYGIRAEALDELSQLVFLAILRQIREGKFRYAQGYFFRYLRKISYYKSIDILRRYYRNEARTQELDDYEVAIMPNIDFDAEEYRDRVIRQLLQELRKKLSPLNYKIFISLSLKGQKPKAIAQKYNIPLPTIYSIRRRSETLISTKLKSKIQ